jgi:branched-chain amino acid transport system ATP-binding protein
VTQGVRTEGLSKYWGGFRANSDITLAIEPGARHALIGPNGAGKTTLINLLTGVFAPSAGDVYLDDERITGLAQHERVRRGLTRTYQVTTLFPGLTALESVVLAVNERTRRARTWWRSVVRCDAEIDEAMTILRSLHLERDAAKTTRALPYGKQRLLEIAVALATRPKFLLLDEPAAGIPAGESTEVFEVLAGLPRAVTLLFIEHDMDLVFRFAERITVLVAGSVLVEGTPREIALDARVKEVYLGGAAYA